MDVFSPEKRSEIMRKIRSWGTGPERAVREWLRRQGVAHAYQARVGRWRADFLVPERKLIIEYRDCFWHAHRCRYGRIPSSNRGYWVRKFLRNKERDFEHDYVWWKSGYGVFVIRKCEAGAWGLESLLRDAVGRGSPLEDPGAVREDGLAFLLGYSLLLGELPAPEPGGRRGRRAVVVRAPDGASAERLARIAELSGFRARVGRGGAVEVHGGVVHLLLSDLLMPGGYFAVPPASAGKAFLVAFLAGMATALQDAGSGPFLSAEGECLSRVARTARACGVVVAPATCEGRPCLRLPAPAKEFVRKLLRGDSF